MAAAAIVIDQAGKPAGVAGESREDLDLLTAVTLSNADNTGVRAWRWSIVSKPTSSTAALSVTTGPVSSFTPDIEGSYLLELQVNGGLAGERSRLIAAVLDGNGFRFPAFGEGTEFNAEGNTNGYGPAIDEILRGVSTTRTIADWKESCRLATAAALPANSTSGGPGPGKRLIANANGALTVDGVAVAVGNRILVKNEGSGANNGIYTVTQTGDGSNPWILTRALDFDENSEVTNGATTSVGAGTANAFTIWVLTTLDPISIDVTVQAWSQLAAALPDHGTLPGLADDDHTQYVLANATRAISSAATGLRVDDANAITLNTTRTRLAAGHGFTTSAANNVNPVGGELDQEAIIGSSVAQQSVGLKLVVAEGSRNPRAEFFLADDVTGSGGWGLALNWTTNGNQPFRLYSSTNLWLEITTAGVLNTWHHSPAADSTYDLGTTTIRWRVGYFDDLNVDANLTFNGATSTILLGTTTAGNAQVRFNKGDANNQTFIQLNMVGVAQWIWQHDTSENCNWLDAAAALVLRLRRTDSNIESRGIRAIADSAHDLGTSSVRWAVIYSDTVDVGAADGSPVVNLNKTGAGTAYVQYRQAVAADTDGDVRVGFDASEQFNIQRRASGSFTTQLYFSSTLGWVSRGRAHVGANGNEQNGDAEADDLMVGDPNLGNGGITIWLGEGVGTINFSIAGSTTPAWIESSADTFTIGLEEAEALELTHSALRPLVDSFMDLGASGQRFQYAFLGTPSYDPSDVVTTGTYNLADEGIVMVNPSGGAVNLQLPLATAANIGKTWLVHLRATTNQVDLLAGAGDAFYEGDTTKRLTHVSNGVGLYIVSVVAADTYSCHGPVARTPSGTT